MSFERDLRVYEERWGPYSLWINESLPPGTMVALLELRIASSSDAMSIPTTIKLDAKGQFTLKLTLLPMLPDTALLVRGQIFTLPTDPA
jgi:hypothetical protein